MVSAGKQENSYKRASKYRQPIANANQVTVQQLLLFSHCFKRKALKNKRDHLKAV